MAHMVSDLIALIKATLIADAPVLTVLQRGDEGVYVMPQLMTWDAVARPKPCIALIPYKWDRVEGTTNSKHRHEVEIFLDFYPSDKLLADPLTMYSDHVAKIEAVLKGTTLDNPTFDSGNNKATLREEGFEPEYIETETVRLIRYKLTYRYDQKK